MRGLSEGIFTEHATSVPFVRRLPSSRILLISLSFVEILLFFFVSGYLRKLHAKYNLLVRQPRFKNLFANTSKVQSDVCTRLYAVSDVPVLVILGGKEAGDDSVNGSN